MHVPAVFGFGFIPLKTRSLVGTKDQFEADEMVKLEAQSGLSQVWRFCPHWVTVLSPRASTAHLPGTDLPPDMSSRL